MERPFLLLAALAVLGLTYVVFPVGMQAYWRFRKRREVNCPEEEKTASVQIDARAVAWAALLDRQQVRVRTCSLWPEKRGCGQRCLAKFL